MTRPTFALSLLNLFLARNLARADEVSTLKKTRAFALAAMLLAVLAVLAPAGAKAADLYNNTNKASVSNGPTEQSVFTLTTDAQISELVTYHWNDGRGVAPGTIITISLRGANGTLYGPFPAQGSPGQGGAPNVNWVATPNVTLPAGDYTVIDSEPATWSQNAQSGHRGFVIVRGTSEDQRPVRGYQYAVKFVCGVPRLPVVAPGQYFTAINVHNPSSRLIRFQKKVAVALPGEKPGPISRFFYAQLKADEALEIDCQDILRHTEAKGFLKGFVVIESESELDVVAVYTGGHPQLETMRMERVPSRSMAKAQIVGPPDPAYCPANQRTEHDAVGNVGCCCNKPKVYPPGGIDTWWPDCKPGLVCVGNAPGPNIGTSVYAVCDTQASANIFLSPPPPPHFSQPPFCGQR